MSVWVAVSIFVLLGMLIMGPVVREHRRERRANPPYLPVNPPPPRWAPVVNPETPRHQRSPGLREFSPTGIYFE